MRIKPCLDWLLTFIPVTLALEHAGVAPPLVFFSAALAIVPIASLIVRATEQIATRTGDAIGGLRYHDQDYNPAASRVYSSMMLIAVMSLAVPSTFSRFFSSAETIHQESLLSIGLAIVLLIAYALYLVFMLKTHPRAFAAKDAPAGEEAHGTHWSLARAVGTPRGRLGARGVGERNSGGAAESGSAIVMAAGTEWT